MKITFITTVFNEERTMERLLESLAKQTRLPDEVVIVDGGSTDKTIEMLKKFSGLPLKIYVKKGNRSIGRNEAVKRATGSIIVCSDAGCILDKKWLEKITEPFKDSTVDVVAGYYQGKAENVFQKCIFPYVLVMEDKVDPDTFLPATRSMAFRKKIWDQIGGFPEQFSHNEDYVFANKLKNSGAKIAFVQKAIVYWIPRTNLRQAFIMFYRFALGDAEAGLFRPKVFMLFLRYILAIIFVILAFMAQDLFLFYLLFVFGILYLLWAALKNYTYVRAWQAFLILPILQLTADMAVLSGTVRGIGNYLWGTKKQQ